MHALAILLLGILPAEDVHVDRVDQLELNHFYDGEGRAVFDQVIFRVWHPGEGAFRVRAWRLWKSEAQTPRRDWRRGGFTMIWLDGDRLRLVRAAGFTETWTKHAPELDDREEFAAHLRSGLSGEKAATASPPAASNSEGP